ncbi:acetoacetate--CoA ligase [Plasticicumulans acidivorans]|uniref:Acetoacetyl-CoA synthetase n=1 Tax=Plasticicumulans acidivorans TaxID=886464 RepID=A0A317MSP1_9GAMM|nr:acetoacetate--CoA ligase [Plasticicumulans acidivorans]PWV60200.1 acetoacetyl-CoA synthetase [Plasticicumulans acidivorans]
MNTPLWQPSPERIARAQLSAFRAQVNATHGLALADYPALYAWSIAEPAAFWEAVWDFGGVIGERGARTLVEAGRMPGAQWFPDASLNFAENLLRRRDEAEAIVFRGEDRAASRLSHAELYAAVSQCAQWLREAGVGEGDRVVAMLPNLPETVIAMLAATSLGAIWSSCSPDFGVAGVLDRFGQIEPKVLIGCAGYFYNGKAHSTLDKLAAIRAELPSVVRVLVVGYAEPQAEVSVIADAERFDTALARFAAGEIAFNRGPFDRPLYIMFSSGTTGVPKCIVHGAGGTLLQHLKEHQLHTDVRPDERVFYFTTCGWMMWNWLVSALAAEATLLLYDGSPFLLHGRVLFDYAEQERMHVFGTSAKFIDGCAKLGLVPRDSHDLSSVRAILSTGSPLLPESFDYVYREVKGDVQLSSISGGTDIVSCFALGNPVLPVWRGELQCRGLGLAVEVWNDAGVAVREEKGELVCTAPFPCMPLCFWNDTDGAKYRAAYFETFPGVWCHGDYVELTAHDGLIIYGRSDAVLNPGGVRIGTAEIYRQVERLPEVTESLVIGQDWAGDVRVVLFVQLREGITLDEALRERIRRQIRANTTPRHVPAKIVQVSDIPRTKSGKIVELAVRNIVHGRPVKNLEALANPEALKLYAGLGELGEE